MESTPANQRKSNVTVSERVNVPATSKVDLHALMFTNPGTEESKMDVLEMMTTSSTFKLRVENSNGGLCE